MRGKDEMMLISADCSARHRAMIEASMKRKLKSGGKTVAGGASSEGGAGIAEVDLSE